MKTQLLLALICLSLLSWLPARAQNTNTNSQPSIPEEARKHFVMGTTLFKDAKTTDDFSQAEAEFKQATDLAPLWPEARYNLALTREAAGDYSGAMADLKRYQHFKLSDSEARTVQDKIYVLEAKQKKASTAAAAKDAAAKAKESNPAAVAAKKQNTFDELLKKIDGRRYIFQENGVTRFLEVKGNVLIAAASTPQQGYFEIDKNQIQSREFSAHVKPPAAPVASYVVGLTYTIRNLCKSLET